MERGYFLSGYTGIDRPLLHDSHRLVMAIRYPRITFGTEYSSVCCVSSSRLMRDDGDGFSEHTVLDSEADARHRIIHPFQIRACSQHFISRIYNKVKHMLHIIHAASLLHLSQSLSRLLSPACKKPGAPDTYHSDSAAHTSSSHPAHKTSCHVRRFPFFMVSLPKVVTR